MVVVEVNVAQDIAIRRLEDGTNNPTVLAELSIIIIVIILVCEIEADIHLEDEYVTAVLCRSELIVVAPAAVTCRTEIDLLGGRACLICIEVVYLTEVDGGIAVLLLDNGPRITGLVCRSVTCILLVGGGSVAEAENLLPSEIFLDNNVLEVLRAVQVSVIALTEYEVLLNGADEGVVKLEGGAGGVVVQIELNACKGGSVLYVLGRKSVVCGVGGIYVGELADEHTVKVNLNELGVKLA